MKAIFSFKVILLFFCIIFISSRLTAQDMGKPQPVDNETLKMLMGTWKSDPYDFMDAKWTETAIHSMKLNGQYLVIEVSAVSDKSQTYNGTIYITPDKDGNWKGVEFDEWGGITPMTGKANGNKITSTSKSDYGSETREIEINGNTMIHNISMSMKGKDGADIPMKLMVTYHKQ